MSACDTCPKPGQCCRGFHLISELAYFETPLHALVAMAAWNLPFLPVDSRYKEWTQQDSSAQDKRRPFTYNCPMLGHDGRCTIYEDRPELCRRYQPGQDQLCAIWQPSF